VAGDRWCVVLGLWGVGVSTSVIMWLSWWGPGAGPHRCGAMVLIFCPCSGGNGQWVGVVMEFCLNASV
jgi:hypothetical protein